MISIKDETRGIDAIAELVPGREQTSVDADKSGGGSVAERADPDDYVFTIGVCEGRDIAKKSHCFAAFRKDALEVEGQAFGPPISDEGLRIRLGDQLEFVSIQAPSIMYRAANGPMDTAGPMRTRCR